MKNPIVLGFVILSVSMALSACSIGNTVNQKAGEEMAEKIIEAQTGGKVDVNSNGENVTIKTEEGQTQYSAGGTAKLPDSFPKELVVIDDAKFILASSSDKGGSVAYLTNFDQTVVFEKYLKDLPALGWKKDMEVDVGNGKMINFSKGKESAAISIGDNESKIESGKTTVNIIYVLEDN